MVKFKLKSNLKKKAKRLDEIERENKVLTSLANSINDVLNYYDDVLETVGNPEDEIYYKNCKKLLELIIPTMQNNEFYKLSEFEEEI